MCWVPFGGIGAHHGPRCALWVSSLFYFFPSPSARRRPRWPPLWSSWPRGKAKGGFGFFAMLKSQRLFICPCPPLSRLGGMPQSRLRFGTLRRICGPIRPQGAPKTLKSKAGQRKKGFGRGRVVAVKCPTWQDAQS